MHSLVFCTWYRSGLGVQLLQIQIYSHIANGITDIAVKSHVPVYVREFNEARTELHAKQIL